MKMTARALILAASLAIAGCASTREARREPEQPKPSASYHPRNFAGEKVLPGSLVRVLVLPVHGGEFAAPETCEYLDPIITTALEQQERFEVVTLSRQECGKSYGTADLSSTDALPADFLTRLGTEYGAQAVLFVDVTAFAPYRPLTLGLRAKLASIADRRLIWSFDDVFCCLDPAVVSGLKRFYTRNSMAGAPVDLSSDDLISPRRFAAYAADAVFQTLPKR
jgi:hypothetical protein